MLLGFKTKRTAATAHEAEDGFDPDWNPNNINPMKYYQAAPAVKIGDIRPGGVYHDKVRVLLRKLSSVESVEHALRPVQATIIAKNVREVYPAPAGPP
jgi:hypothetical protein